MCWPALQVRDWQGRVEQYKTTVAQLEADKLSLSQQSQDLAAALEEQGATFRSQVDCASFHQVVVQ